MPIDGVQNYNITSRSGALANVMVASGLGAAAGYGAKLLLPLNAEESKNVPRRSILNVARKETNKKMVEDFMALNKRTEAQDVFVKMIKEKDFKSSDKIFAELEKTKPQVAKDFKKIVKIADKDSSAVARQYMGAYHKLLKCMRPNNHFVGVGAAVGMLAGVLYNACTHTDRV